MNLNISALNQARTQMRNIMGNTYDGRCTVTEYGEYVDTNHITHCDEVEKYSDIPCRLIYANKAKSKFEGKALSLEQEIVLNIDPIYEISPNAKITVTQNGITNEYQMSGVPSVYASHQEIKLEIFKGW